MLYVSFTAIKFTISPFSSDVTSFCSSLRQWMMLCVQQSLPSSNQTFSHVDSSRNGRSLSGKTSPEKGFMALGFEIASNDEQSSVV